MFLLDPEDPGKLKCQEEVIMESGGRKSPAGSRGRAPGGGLGGKDGGLGRSPQKLNRF